MEETTNNDNLNNYRSVQITGMELELFNAAMKEIVSKLLTRYSSAAKEADENGWLPLHLAALCARSSEVVELLVSKDRSTAYMRDNKGRTALHLAAFHGHSFIMEKILKYCPDCCELVDEKGNNALHYTTMKERDPFFYGLERIMKVAPLISNLCNEKDDDGNTPLHLLAHRAPECQYSCTHSLLEPHFERVDKMALNKYGQTVLDVAVAHVPQDKPLVLNKMVKKLQDIGARLGGRVPDKHLRVKKQEKIHDAPNTVDETEDEFNLQKIWDRKATTNSVVATLIATVTFTAAFTLPGGLFQDGKDKGSPILERNAAFITFVVTNSLSFVLSAAAVFSIFLSSIYNAEILQGVHVCLLLLSTYLTAAAMGFMAIAFGTGMYAVLGVSRGFGVVTLLIVLSFLLVTSFLYRWIDTSMSRIWSRVFYRGDYNLEMVSDFQLSHTL